MPLQFIHVMRFRVESSQGKPNILKIEFQTCSCWGVHFMCLSAVVVVVVLFVPVLLVLILCKRDDWRDQVRHTILSLTDLFCSLHSHSSPYIIHWAAFLP